jgi:hypothetical protein
MDNRYLGEEVLIPEQKEKSFVDKVKDGYNKLTKKDTYSPEAQSTASFIETPASSLAVGAVVTGISKAYFKQNWVVSASLGIAVAGAKYLLIDEKNAPLPNEKTKF